MDKVPDTSQFFFPSFLYGINHLICSFFFWVADSPEVQTWMKELDGFDIPDLEQTVDGTCLSSPELAANAASRGWWTCGGYTRDTG